MGIQSFFIQQIQVGFVVVVIVVVVVVIIVVVVVFWFFLSFFLFLTIQGFLKSG